MFVIVTLSDNNSLIFIKSSFKVTIGQEFCVVRPSRRGQETCEPMIHILR